MIVQNNKSRSQKIITHNKGIRNPTSLSNQQLYPSHAILVSSSKAILSDIIGETASIPPLNLPFDILNFFELVA